MKRTRIVTVLTAVALTFSIAACRGNDEPPAAPATTAAADASAQEQPTADATEDPTADETTEPAPTDEPTDEPGKDNTTEEPPSTEENDFPKANKKAPNPCGLFSKTAVQEVLKKPLPNYKNGLDGSTYGTDVNGNPARICVHVDRKKPSTSAMVLVNSFDHWESARSYVIRTHDDLVQTNGVYQGIDGNYKFDGTTIQRGNVGSWSFIVFNKTQGMIIVAKNKLVATIFFNGVPSDDYEELLAHAGRQVEATME
ncbi:MAG TPA: hypothetical protein VD735_06750 [Candidatus Saccharimonadales bacterium]|nr:hypothetical protein [Candidatus Saccharimonadales bacterium]